MKLTLVLILFLIAAILFLLDFFLAWAVAEPQYGPYRYRVYSLAWGLMAIGFMLWHGGQ